MNNPFNINEIDAFLRQLFPICRSLTGEGNRKTLKLIQKLIPIELKEIPSGKQVYDWTIPEEWNIRSAWVKNSKGEKIIDFTKFNVSVVSYSTPIHLKNTKFKDIEKHFHSLPETPNSIPYRTSYYNKTWGFCLTQNERNKIAPEEELEVFIDSSFNENGSMSYGELLIPGKSEREVLLSSYICHPSLANDSLSGVVGATFLAQHLLKQQPYYSYRVIFVPETIGAIAYLSQNPSLSQKTLLAFILTTMGGPGPLGYKQSFIHNHHLHHSIETILDNYDRNFKVYPFDIHGSDERQYSSPGFRIPSISITKDKYYEYSEYHTSADNLDYVKAEYIAKTLDVYLQIFKLIDKDRYYINLSPYGEVQLGKRNLYPQLGGTQLPSNAKDVSELDIILQVLFSSDGNTPLRVIADILKLPLQDLMPTVDKLVKEQLLALIK